METSRDKYYTEIFRTLTDYNDLNNSSLLSEKIREAIRKVMKEESISYANKVPANTLVCTSNTQRENENVIFTNEKLDKSDELIDALNDLTINDTEK